jgi:tRNA pseudouridine55 synthase
MYSAVHHNGKRLYELARQGIDIERKERTVKIYSLELTKVEKDRSGVYITLRVLCSPGTYIRTLCDDIGRDLGTGAYVSKLQRTRSGCFTIDNSSALEELCRDTKTLSRYVLPLDCVLQDYQYINLKTQADIDAIGAGNFVLLDSDEVWEEKPVVVTAYDEIIALAKLAGKNKRTGLQPVKVFKR